jgi:hypothetical protein
VLLTHDVSLAGFALRIERIELLLEAFLRGFASVDGAADTPASSPFPSPKMTPLASRARWMAARLVDRRLTAALLEIAKHTSTDICEPRQFDLGQI